MSNLSKPSQPVPPGTKAIIFAAGMGTRFRPWTDAHPKALAIVLGKTLLERNITYLQGFGIFDVIVNVHHFPEQISQAIDSSGGWGSRVSISDESGELLETGGGLNKAGWFFDSGPFVAINVDILTDLDLGSMLGSHLERKPLVTLAVTDRVSSRYFLFTSEGRLGGWRNQATGAERILVADLPLTSRAFSGVQVIDPRIFSEIHLVGRFSLVDLYLDLAPSEKILAFDHSGSRLIDVGRSEAVLEAERLFG
jgi:N-acetyl-alpha-D-muramate 1-phosphate uridylyltransferase